MKKFLVLGISLILASILTMGLSFGQESQSTQAQEKGQPIIISLFGVNWVLSAVKILGSFDDLNVIVVEFYVRDMINMVGVAKFVVIAKKDEARFRIVGGWLKPHSLAEKRGFFVKEDGKFFMTPGTYLEGKAVVCELKQDQAVLKFTFLKMEYDETAQKEVLKKKLVRIIDIKKFVEENFKDEG